MPTTNPVPSHDPSDLLFNAEKLDEIVSGTATSFTDRLGVQRRTLAGLSAEFPNAAANSAAAAASAVDAADSAQTAQDEAAVAAEQASAANAARVAAEAARDAAAVNSTVYPDVLTGLAAVADGEYYLVLGQTADEAARLYLRVNSGSASLQKTYPTLVAVNAKAPIASPTFTGSPAAPNQANNDSSTKLATTSFVQGLINSAATVSLLGATSPYVLTDVQGRNRILFLTGALTTDINVEFPARSGIWIIRNLTTGGYKAKLKVTGQASSVDTVNGQIINVYSNGATLSEVDAHKAPLASPAFSGAPTAPTADQGDRSLQLANTTFAHRVAQGYASVAITSGVNTLSLSNVGVKTLAFTGTLTADAEVVFPKQVGEFVVRNSTAGGKSLILKVQDQATGFVTLKSLAVAHIISNASSLFAVAQAAEGGAVSAETYKGLLEIGANYSAGDIVTHGSGVYKVLSSVAGAGNPTGDAAFSKIRHNTYAGPEREIIPGTATLTPVLSNKSPAMMSADRSKVWSINGTQLWESQDEGATWTQIAAFPSKPVDVIREMDNGELLVILQNTLTYRRDVIVSSGYSTNPATMTWTTVFSTVAPAVNFTSAWSVSIYKNIVLLAEYGPKEGEAWGGVTAQPGENARYVYMSTNYGKSFKTIFDLNEHSISDGVHVHGVCFDPWWNRIWVTWGDKTNATMYSDDIGVTWTFANHGLLPESPNQNVGIVALPTCVLFGTDVAPNGIQRIDRAHGKYTADGTYPIDVAYALNSETVTRTHLCHGIFQARNIPDAPVLFGFGAESNPAPSVIVATHDGWNFTELWRDTQNQAAGFGLRQVFGPTLQGNVIALSNDQRTPGYWTQIKFSI